MGNIMIKHDIFGAFPAHFLTKPEWIHDTMMCVYIYMYYIYSYLQVSTVIYSHLQLPTVIIIYIYISIVFYSYL